MNARLSVFAGAVLVFSSLAGAQYLSNKCCKDTLASPCHYSQYCFLREGHYMHVEKTYNIKVCQTMTDPFLLVACDDQRPEAIYKQKCADIKWYATLEDCGLDRNPSFGSAEYPGCQDSC
jgi:hypothetical protein